MNDRQLLRDFVRIRSQDAFRNLVERHLPMVYSAAQRIVRDPQLAEEVAQSVFTTLARKAESICPPQTIAGWLYNTTRHLAMNTVRSEHRRREREKIAVAMQSLNSASDPQHVSEHLEPAMGELAEDDRDALVLRYFENRSLREVGAELGISEDAARMRVNRALERLRAGFERRGVAVTTVLLGGAMISSTTAVPSALTAAIASAALTGLTIPASAGLGAGTGFLGALSQVCRTKLMTGVAATVFVGAATLFLLRSHNRADRGAASQPQQITPDNPQVPQAEAMTKSASTAFDSNLSDKNQASGKRGALTGLVLDEHGNPIFAARVWCGSSSQPSAQDSTDGSGQFALDQIAGPAYVTVTADGFAADQQEFDPANATGMLVFRLSPMRPLDLRLVDESGQGVPGVRLFLGEWWGRRGTLGQYLPGQTDADGRWQWLSPPKGELQVECIKAGYRYSRTNKLAADGKEHVIVLHPVAIVTGSVTDAETSSLVASFRMTLGHAQPWNPDNPVPMWDRQSRAASNGFYRVVIEEEQVPYLRVEADGYETVETVIQLTNAVEGAHDFQLKRLSEGNSIRGTVLLPDGSLAVGVEVALCTAIVGVRLSGTAFEPGAFGNIPQSQWPAYRRRTDEQGIFWFDPKPGAHTVVAVGPAGLGWVRCFDFSNPLEIQLQPWGRIEGNVRTRDGQWADRKLHWRPTGHSTRWQTLFCEAGRSAARSDATGRFTLQHIPPGGGWVATDDGPGTAPILSPSLEVTPGETVQVQIGGLGRSVTGRLVAPPGLEIRSWSNQVKFARVQADFEKDSYQMPRDLTGNAAERWRLEFEDTEAGRTCSRSQYSYDFTVEADGSFTLPEVLPGKYWLFVNLGRGYLGSGSDSRTRPPEDPLIAQAGMKFSVPDAPGESGTPVNVGEIVLTAIP